MSGVHKGLQALLRARLFVWLLFFWCIAHRLHLGVCDAADAIDYFKNFESVLKMLFSYFSRSANRKGQLSGCFAVLDLAQKELIKWCLTRWLSRGGSVKSVASVP